MLAVAIRITFVMRRFYRSQEASKAFFFEKKEAKNFYPHACIKARPYLQPRTLAEQANAFAQAQE